ncbi:hypothetical protein ADU37_CDS10630 [Thermococcus sp. 2319x1]|nr:hypothetical protein ADU37_CDS10630 [Thermococcus sp. 2319x1]
MSYSLDPFREPHKLTTFAVPLEFRRAMPNLGELIRWTS